MFQVIKRIDAMSPTTPQQCVNHRAAFARFRMPNELQFFFPRVASGQSVKIRATTGNPKNDLLQSLTKSLQEVVDNAPKKP